MKVKSILILFCWFLSSCSSGEPQSPNTLAENPIDSFESALPHGKTLKDAVYSDEDRLKLAQAHGRKTEPISFDALKTLIETDTSGLVLYHFWNLDCQPCKSTIDVLKKLQYEVFDTEDFKVVYINTDGLYPKMINSYIREKEIVDQIFTVSVDTIPDWSSYFQNGWEGQLPAILVVNNDDGTRLFYQKEFSLEELQAVLLPLTL